MSRAKLIAAGMDEFRGLKFSEHAGLGHPTAEKENCPWCNPTSPHVRQRFPKATAGAVVPPKRAKRAPDVPKERAVHTVCYEARPVTRAELLEGCTRLADLLRKPVPRRGVVAWQQRAQQLVRATGALLDRARGAGVREAASDDKTDAAPAFHRYFGLETEK